MQPFKGHEVTSVSGPYVRTAGRWHNAYGGAIRSHGDGTYTVRWVDVEGARTTPTFDSLAESYEHYYACIATAQQAVAAAAFEVMDA